MVGCENQHYKHQNTEPGKQDVHPLFVQKVDGGDCHVASLLAMTFNDAVLAMTFSMFVVVVSMSVFVNCVFMLAAMRVSFCVVGVRMCAVVMSELSSGKRCNEKSQSHQHADAFPSEMPSCSLLAPVWSVLLFLMDNITTIAFSLHPEVVSLYKHVHEDAYHDGQHEKDSEEHKCLLRNHCKHDESLISGRRDHHGN